MKSNGSFPSAVFVAIVVLGGSVSFALYRMQMDLVSGLVLVVAVLCAALVSSAIRVADLWSKSVVLRLGKFRSLKGPGLFFIFPFIETIPYWIDTRVLTSSLKAEKTLTKDTAPGDVDAVLFWKIVDLRRAALYVADYQAAIGWASQTARGM